MDPYEPIFLNNSNGIRPKTFVYTDVIDDETVASDMTWSSNKIHDEIQRISREQTDPISAGLPGQLLRTNDYSEPEWAYFADIVRMITNGEIDALFANPNMAGVPSTSFIDGDGIAHLFSILKTALNAKVDKVDGKGLSENDFTDTHRSTLEKIESGNYVTVRNGTLIIDRTVAGGGT